MVENGEKVKTDIHFLNFPKDPKEIAIWCNKIKRQDGKDGFRVTSKTVLCDKHFLPDHLKKAAGSKRVNRQKGAIPVLFSWNNWRLEGPVRRSVIRKVLQETNDQNPASVGESAAVQESDETFEDIERNELEKQNTTLREEREELLKARNELLCENKNLKEEIEDVRVQVQLMTKDREVCDLLIEKISRNDNVCCHYTGFSTVKRMQATFDYCNPGQDGENLLMHTSKTDKIKAGRPRALTPFKGYMLTLFKLRQNFSFQHLSFLFNIGVSTCSKTFLMWISFLYLRLGMISIWPSRQILQQAMPKTMKEKFPNTKVIIDCSEIFVECPSSFHHQKMLYSSYKSHVTLKILFGIKPGGGFSFISACFVGSISDREICIKSGFLSKELWEPGDAVMADRGFTISDLLEPLGMELIIPNFLKGRDQLSILETIRSQQISAERIHIERMIERFKNFRIFESNIPITMFGKINEIVTVCALLCNFQDPIIST